jgi:putative membrane protein
MGRMVSEPAESQAQLTSVEQRLHPLSFLFKFLTQGTRVLGAVVVVMVLRTGDLEREIGGGITAAVLVASYALVRSRSFRYRLAEQELWVREGVFGRTERRIPYARIQNIVQRRTALHHFFGVTELRIESAGGTRPEAIMSVITLEAARAIEAAVRDRALPDSAVAVGDGVAQASAQPLLRMSVADVLRFGLVTGGAWQVLGATMVFIVSQLDWRHVSDAGMVRQISHVVQGWAQELGRAAGQRVGQVVAGLLGVMALLAVLKVLSVAVAFLRFHGFRLDRRGDQLRTVSGLLDRRVGSVRTRQIQRLCVGESWLARRLGRRWLACAVATGGDADQRLSWLAPLGTHRQIDDVLMQVAPGLDLSQLAWNPVHPRAWQRRLLTRVLAISSVTLAAFWFLGLPALFGGLALAAVATLEARAWARFAAYAITDQLVAVRLGWWERQWRLAWLNKGQVMALRQSPMDRRHHMASVLFDTAGPSDAAPAIRIPFLPQDQARRLYAQLLKQ